MIDLFANLVQRSRGENTLTPALPSHFEPGAAEAEPWDEVEEMAPARTRAAQRLEPPIVQAATEGKTVEERQMPTGVVGNASDSRPADSARGPRSTLDDANASRRPTDSVAHVADVPDLAAIVADALRQRIGSNQDAGARGLTDTESEATSARPTIQTRVIAPPILERAQAGPAGPAMERGRPDQPEAQPAIEVRIGRIEVTASPAPPPRPASPAPRVQRSREPRLPLADYLARRGRR